MFEYIRGTLTSIEPAYLVIEAGGIGYQVLMANPFRLSDKLDQEETIYVYQSFTQDSLRLYGFINAEEKALFMKLINVSGIGPKSALSILALEDHVGLVRAIEDADVAYLQKFPGVGKKTASQIILDLQGKLSELSPEIIEAFKGQADITDQNEHLEEAIEALGVLGYSARDLKKVRQVLEDKSGLTTDEYMREGLAFLIQR